MKEKGGEKKEVPEQRVSIIHILQVKALLFKIKN